MSKLTQSRLKELLRYDPDDGSWTLIAVRKGYRIGTKLGNKMTHGYIRVGVDMERHLSHRLAWLYMTGEWPGNEIDHIDGNPSNNRWENLREATSSQQKWNAKPIRRSTPYPKGVTKSLRNLSKPFTAQIQYHGIRKYLGMFKTAEEAAAAYAAAAQKYFGEYARLA